MVMQARIATAWGTHEPSRQKASKLIERVFNKDPRIERMSDLAGPNDTIQILLDWSWWQQLAVGAMTVYGGGILAQAGANTWNRIQAVASKALKSKAEGVSSDAVKDFSDIVSDAQNAGNTVILGLPVNENFQRRNIGIELRDSSSHEIIQAMAVLTNVGGKVSATINELIDAGLTVRATEENSDCSAKINVGEDGTATVRLRVFDKDQQNGRDLVITFSPDGEELPN